MNGDGTEVKIGFEPTQVTALEVNITDSYNQASTKFAQAGEIKTYEVVDKEVTPPPATHDYKIVVEPAALTMNVGETATLTAKAMDGDQELTEVALTWDPAATSVIQMERTEGATAQVTAVGAGVSDSFHPRVTATFPDGGLRSGGCTITVTQPAVTSTIAINDVEYQATSLEDAITQSGQIGDNGHGYIISNVSSIDFKTGVITKADFDYIKTNKQYFDYELKIFRIQDAVTLSGLAGDAIPSMAFDLNGTTGVGLTEVYLGVNVKKLDYNAFPVCKDLVTFAAPGVESLHTISGTCLGRLSSLKTLSLPALKEFKLGRNTITYFSGRLEIPGVTVIGRDVFGTQAWVCPTDVVLGAQVPSLYPASAKVIDCRKPVNLHVPDEAIAAYKASPLYDETTGKWGRPEAHRA